MAEIEDVIFEWATHMFPPDAASFSVVSKRLQRRVEAIMYETIVFISYNEIFRLRNMTYVERFEVALHSRPAEFFAAHVRNVCITNSVPKEIATLILSKCTGIRNLAIWQHRNPVKLDPVEAISPFASTLSSLSAGRYTLRRLAESGYVFPNLKFVAVGIHPLSMDLPTMEWLPALRTLRMRLGQQPFDDDMWTQDVKIVISTAPQLQALLLDVDQQCLDDVSVRVAEFNDERIVVRDEYTQSDPIVEWKESFWI
ncbi:hypothetical protein FPV67DRAFT_1167878 [Lyophyllum atratum]|nr:hypothetical protein FPV67DRAFT_1167878 [Lyophyllum atratum]